VPARPPEPPAEPTSPWRPLIGGLVPALVTGILHLAAAQVAQVLDDPGRVGAVFWPGAGVSVTALLVTRRRAWPAILFAIGLAEAASVALQDYHAPFATVFWVLGNTVQPVVIAGLLRGIGTGSLRRSARTLRFVIVASLGGIVGGLLGAVGTTMIGSGLPYWLIVLRWAIGDGLGVLTVVPFGLLLCGRLDRGREDLRELTRPEPVAAVLVTVVATALVFLPLSQLSQLPVAFLVLPPMVWVAGRLGLAATAVTVFVVAQIANAGTALGHGPLAAADVTPLTASTLSQLFLAVATVTVLLLASSRAESATFEDLATTREHLIAAVSHELRTPR
jgi:integral membrane sensor domain MASE1